MVVLPMSSQKQTNSVASPEEGTVQHKRLSDGFYQAYKEHRASLFDSENDAGRRYDKWVLTLSGGALALSMAFAREIAIPAGAHSTGWLLAAWIALGLAIAFDLVSIYESQKAAEDSRGVLDKTLEAAYSAGEAGFWARVSEAEEPLRRPRWIDRLNLVSLIAFLGGISSLAMFAYLNVPRE